MAGSLRSPWVTGIITKKLNDVFKRRNEGPLKVDEIIDTIGPSGELRLPGGTGKTLQIIWIDLEDSCTVKMSDKTVKITCKISSEARQNFETSSKIKMPDTKGVIVKIESFEIYLSGADGKLFWEGATYQSQIADEQASQKRSKIVKRNIQNKSVSGESTGKGLRAGNKDNGTELPSVPEPIFYITDFRFVKKPDSLKMWGEPVSISLRSALKGLLLDLPRKERPPREPMLNQSGLFSSKKNSNTSSASSKWSAGGQTSDDEIRSQTGVHDGNSSSQEVLQFTTQVHAHYLDDLDFSTRTSQKKKPGATHPQSPPPKKSEPSIQEKKMIPRPHHARKNAEQTKSLSRRSKLINYADGSDSEEPAISSAVREGNSKDLSKADNQNKRKRDDDPNSTSGSDSTVGIRRKGKKKKPLLHPGWQGMRRITEEQTIIPEYQQEILNRPESSYSYKGDHHVSGYDFVSKEQLVPKSHPPREPPKSPNIQVIVPPVSSFRSSLSSPADTEIPWPSTPVKSPSRDLNAMPPDSSFLSGTQSPLAGRWSAKSDIPDAQESSDDGSFNQPSQVSIQEVRKLSCSQPPAETYEKYDFKLKRVTRAANGISKKTPVDPNNVEPSRMAKASKKQKLPAVRKHRPRHEYQSEDENYQSSEDDLENISELINHPNLPVGVVDPNGRTRVAVFGGILKAQQVDLWEQNGKQPQKLQDEDENEDTQSDTDYGEDGDFNDLVWDKKLGSGGEINADGNAPEELIKEVVGATVLKSLSPGPHAKQTENQQYTGGVLPVESASPDSLAVYQDIPDRHPKTTKPLPSSEHSSIPVPARENDNISESLPKPPEQLSIHDQTDEDEDDEIPQAPLVPPSSTLNYTARILDILDTQCSDVLGGGSVETSKKRIPSQVATDAEVMVGLKYKKGGGPSTAILLQDSSVLKVPNTFETQRFDEDIGSVPVSSPIGITAPSIQVKETPYGKETMTLGGDLSPIVAKPKSHIDSACADEGLDLTLIPGTNTEEVHKSQEPTPSPEDQISPTTRPLTIPESSIESKDPQKRSLGDFSGSQVQLIREAEERPRVGVLATSEIESTRKKDEILSHLTPGQQVPRSGLRKARKVHKAVDFGTQEIHAVGNTRDVANMLEEQKREFMGWKDVPNFTDTAQRTVDPTVEVPKNFLSSPNDESLATPSRLSRSNDEKMASSTTGSITRKRIKSPFKHSTAVKKPRVGVSVDRAAYVPAPPFSERQNVKTSRKLPTESSPKSRMRLYKEEGRPGGEGHCEEEDFSEKHYMEEGHVKNFEEKDIGGNFEFDTYDPMDGFPDIDLGDDEPLVMTPEIIDLTSGSEKEYSPPGLPETLSKPELYAGLRMRDILVPGYERHTDEQKEELDRRRQQYFGVRQSSERLFSVERQRAMSKAGLRESKKDNKKARESHEDEWYRDKDTPMKKFFRQFQELERSRMSKSELNKLDG